MKILFPNAYYDPEQVANSHLMNDLEKTVSDAGIEYVVYAPTPTRGIDSSVRKEYKKIKKLQKNVKIIRYV